MSTKLKKTYEEHARTKDTKNIENGGSYLMNSELQSKTLTPRGKDDLVSLCIL